MLARTAGASNDADTTEMEFDSPVGVTIIDQPMSITLDTQEFDDYEGGLLDVYYPAEGAVPHDPTWHVWWVYGPTYYLDGRVDYPEWWFDTKTGQ